MSWEVILHEDVNGWYLRLAAEDPESAQLVGAAIDLLAAEGPTLGRPLVDRVKQSRHHHMKELRPGSTGMSEIRLLFAFDPQRQALILVAGDKNGAWASWYDQQVPIADDRFDEHLEDLST
ncbi:type II toxin-antitoxin system RelE/ParE family toxin [Streptantibioticus parmotrematis]|uniref:type II toxin-antitoxin system RelE/ParE family toxin n=1 Tax=Streptantibioticus parmotrematis TaxID=2873249 RepID=UPI0033E0CE71